MAGNLQRKLRGALRSLSESYSDFREGLDPRQRRLLHVLAFLTRFTALALPFYLILGSGWSAEGLRSFTADFSAASLRLLGFQASSTGSFVEIPGMVVDVTRDSTGWKSVVVFSALVAASQRDWRSKVNGVLAGAAFILGVNLLRITSMVYAVDVFGVDYEFLHTFLWRWGLTAAVIASWAYWMRISGHSTRFHRG